MCKQTLTKLILNNGFDMCTRLNVACFVYVKVNDKLLYLELLLNYTNGSAKSVILLASMFQ